MHAGVLYATSTFACHISTAVSNTNRLLGLIKNCFSYTDKKQLKTLNTAIVWSHLEHAKIVQHHVFKKHIKLFFWDEFCTGLLIKYLNLSLL